MKKLLLLLLLIPFCSFAQMDTITNKVLLKNYAGIEIYGTYKLNKVKPGKKEYIINVEWKNKTGEELFYKELSGAIAATAKIKGDKVNWFSVIGDKSNKKITGDALRIIYPNKYYKYHDVKKWYNENEVPEFELTINSNVMENDYKRYE